MIDIENFLNQQDLDIRKSGNNPRFIDQKCTPDVISFIADTILNLEKNKFTSIEVENSEHFCKLVVVIFGKPSPKNNKLNNEYNKFSSQVLDMLSYAHILEKSKKGRTNYFKIINKDVLEYISLRDRNAYVFLSLYLKKFFKDSGFEKYLNLFFENQNKENYKLLKNKFENLIIVNSKIGTRGSKTNGKTEIRRMFPKAINPIALSMQSKGTSSGHLSKGIITYSELVYNRQNFRDIGKLKNISRKEQEQINSETKNYNKYLMTKAKQWVRRNHPQSEVRDDLYGKTSQAHHIFPRNSFPIIADYIENLIALTSGQHMDKAHPNGNTTQIDIAYQHICLKMKNNTIKNELLSPNQTQYSKKNFIFVLNTGFCWSKTDNEIEYKASFDVLDRMIDIYYKSA